METLIKWGAFGFVVLLIVGSIGFTIAIYQNENTYEIEVVGKENKASGDSSRHLIFAKVDGETKVFENTDALFASKFNSSDIYAELTVGKTYEVKTIGFRVPFLSMYENILEINEKGSE
jgi:hypothetical protein